MTSDQLHQDPEGHCARGRTRLGVVLGALCVAALLGLTAGPTPLSGVSVTTAFSARNADCVRCHSGRSGEGAPVVKVDAAAASATEWHARLDCLECHSGSSGTDCVPIANATDVCIRCHPGYDGPGRHPTRPDNYDAAAGKGLTCTSTCHDPHGGVYRKMMRCPYGEQGHGTDGLCLKCHGQDALP